MSCATIGQEADDSLRNQRVGKRAMSELVFQRPADKKQQASQIGVPGIQVRNQ